MLPRIVWGIPSLPIVELNAPDAIDQKPIIFFKCFIFAYIDIFCSVSVYVVPSLNQRSILIWKKHKCANLTHKTQISRYCGWKVRAYFNHNRYWGMEKLLHPTKIVDVIIYLSPGHRPAFSLKWVPGFEIFRTHTERVNLVHYALAWGILFSISYRDVRPFHYVKGSSQRSQTSDKAACYSR